MARHEVVALSTIFGVVHRANPLVVCHAFNLGRKGHLIAKGFHMSMCHVQLRRSRISVVVLHRQNEPPIICLAKTCHKFDTVTLVAALHHRGAGTFALGPAHR